MENLRKTIINQFSPAEAAALAVLAAHVARSIDSVEDKGPGDVESLTVLSKLEEFAIESLMRNDGSVTYWIGVAAKQMNPLLS